MRNLISYIFTVVLLLAAFLFCGASGFEMGSAANAGPSLFIKPQCDPLQPTIVDSVSVDPATGIIRVSWFPNPSPDTDYYVVYIYNASTSPPWNPVANVPGAAISSTTISGYNGANGSYVFAVSAFNTCGEQSYFDPAPEDNHNSIFLQTLYNSCDLQIELNWNKYNNFQGGVDNYEIWYAVDGNPYQLIATTDGGDTTYTHTGLPSEADVCYFIRAKENNGIKTSASNKSCVYTDFPNAPKFSYIRYVTVQGDSSVKIKAYVDASADVSEYIIERKTSGSFDSIASVHSTDLAGELLEYTDNEAVPGEISHIYRIKTINSCGTESGVTNEAKSIFLEAENQSDAMRNNLEWSSYLEWNGNVESYNIYRVTGENYEKIGNVPAGFHTYSDNVSELYTGDGEFCYYIEAAEGEGNSFGFKEKSSSNMVCVEQKPFLYIPNAFTPGGSNPVFKPVFSFVEPDTYHFAIYNKWGDKFFETRDTQTGWDGNTKSGPASPDTYVFYIEYKSAFGQSFSKTGTVTLLR